MNLLIELLSLFPLFYFWVNVFIQKKLEEEDAAEEEEARRKEQTDITEPFFVPSFVVPAPLRR